MQKKNIRREDLNKITEEIFQRLEKIIEWSRSWTNEAKRLVKETLEEFFKVPKDKMAEAQCFAFGNRIQISNFRVSRVTERIFDNFKEGSLPLDEIHWTDYKTFARALPQITGAFARYVEFVDLDSDDFANEEDIGHEPWSY